MKLNEHLNPEQQEPTPKATSVREAKWEHNYGLLKNYVAIHGQFPDKHHVEHRALLNWWKYNRRLLKKGLLSEDKVALLKQVSQMRVKRRDDLE